MKQLAIKMEKQSKTVNDMIFEKEKEIYYNWLRDFCDQLPTPAIKECLIYVLEIEHLYP